MAVGFLSAFLKFYFVLDSRFSFHLNSTLWYITPHYFCSANPIANCSFGIDSSVFRLRCFLYSSFFFYIFFIELYSFKFLLIRYFSDKIIESATQPAPLKSHDLVLLALHFIENSSFLLTLQFEYWIFLFDFVLDWSRLVSYIKCLLSLFSTAKTKFILR